MMKLFFRGRPEAENSEVVFLVEEFLHSIGIATINFSENGNTNVAEFDYPDHEPFPSSGLAAHANLLSVNRGSSSSVSFTNEGFNRSDCMGVIDALIEQKIKEYGYDNIVSACSYWNSTVPKFNREGRAFIKWRDMIWLKCFEILESLDSGMSNLNMEEAVASLPVFEDILASIDQ